MSLANSLTFIRIFISPIFLLLWVAHDTFGIPFIILPYILLCLLGISELSDAFDGYVARKYYQVTDIGKILDPMADSIYRISVFLSFTQSPVNLSILLVFIFIYRDSVIGTLRTVCALKGHALAARTSGKIKAIIQAISAFVILFLLIPYSMNYLSQKTLHLISTWIVSFAGLYSLYSGGDYLIANRHYLKTLFGVDQKLN